MSEIPVKVGERVNRYVNLIAGLGFGLFGAYAAGSYILAGGFNAHVLMVVLAGVLALVIAGLGLAELRQPTAPGIAQRYERIPHREEATV